MATVSAVEKVEAARKGEKIDGQEVEIKTLEQEFYRMQASCPMRMMGVAANQGAAR